MAKENTMVPGFINTYLAGTWYIWANIDGHYGKKAPILVHLMADTALENCAVFSTVQPWSNPARNAPW